MSGGDTVLAHLSGGFSSGAENAATKALAYILNRSGDAREALDDVVRSGVKDVEPIVEVRTQVFVREGVVPDLVGKDGDGRRRVIVEVKFWADLTPNQPVAYFEPLPDDGPAVLLFLVPDERVRRLWPELRRRVRDSGRPLWPLSEVDAERRCMRVDGTHRHLMVIGWTGLLDCMATRARDAGEHGIEADVRQLRGLVDYVAARPVPERDGDERYLRRIIDLVTDRGVHSGWLNTKGLNRQRRKGCYGRYVRFLESGVTPWFGINYGLSKSGGETRLWLRFSPPAPKRGRIGQAQFDALRRECRSSGQEGWSWVPLILKRDIDFSEVLDDVSGQLERISVVIHNAGVAAVAADTHPA